MHRFLAYVSRHRWVADGLALILTAGASAVAALVAEDLMPGDGKAPNPMDTRRLVALVVLLVLLGVVILVRWLASRALGTLYYIYFQMPWKSDWHLPAERDRRRSFQDERVVYRFLTARPVSGVIDAVDEVTQVGRDLQLTMNDDSVDTGYTLAPNLEWPAAVALGYGMYGWDGLRFLELGDEAETMTWALDGDPRDAGFAVPQWRILREPEAPSGARSVLLTVDLTTGGATTVPRGFAADAELKVAVWAGTSADDAPLQVRISPTLLSSHTGSVVHPVSATRAVVDALRQALGRYPEATIYVILRVTKTVAMAIGYRLAGPGSALRAEPRPAFPPLPLRRPWRRLVPLLGDQDYPVSVKDRYLAVRVHPDQPAVAQLVVAAQGHGLELSPGPGGEQAEARA